MMKEHEIHRSWQLEVIVKDDYWAQLWPTIAFKFGFICRRGREHPPPYLDLKENIYIWHILELHLIFSTHKFIMEHDKVSSS